MTTALQTSHLATLKAIGIINASHVRRALAHPQLAELDAYPDLPHLLVWLVCRDILTEDQLRQACRHVTATYSGDELDRHNAVLAETIALLDRLRDNFNQQWIDTLVTEDLITEEEGESALASVSTENVLASPAAALAWMTMADVISSKRLNEIRATADQGSAERRAILAEAEGIFAQANAAARSIFWRELFPGPRWLWIAAPVLFLGLMIWIR
ncbi:hypothetical protein [Massilia sp. TWP1-3-3]|uniref:hypothetical protein n=1 Tax=Massilia sp. TWP1-3-3 TaxID=2804573 RepID=UPI003CF8A55C